MVNTVYDAKEIKLQDGKEVELRPCSISLLKKVMKAWEKVSEVKSEEDIFEVYLNCVGICLSREFSEEYEKPLAVNGLPNKEFKAHLEDIMDMPTIYEVLEVCANLKLRDENLAEAVVEAMEEQETPGTT